MYFQQEVSHDSLEVTTDKFLAYEEFKRQYESGHLHKRQSVQPPGAEGNMKGGWMDSIWNWGSMIASIPSYIWSLSTGGTGSPPTATVPEMQLLRSVDYPQAKRVKIRYGPFRIPPKQEKNFNNLWWSMEGISTTFRLNVKRPCEEDCMILGIEAAIEYADGSPANTSNGAIFHHTVLLNTGPGVVEPTCSSSFLENIFMAGNERTPTNYALPNSQQRSGYVLSSSDTLLLNTELQNMSDKEKYVWETISYDIVEGVPKEYESAHIVWLAVGTQENPSIISCRSGENPFGTTNLTKIDQPTVKVFSEHSQLWHSDKSGTILQAGGHLHDGGLDVMLFKNHELFCDSVAKYANGAASHHHGKRQIDGGAEYSNEQLQHIESVETCKFPGGVPLEKGDVLHIQANYNFDQHKGMKNAEGKLDQIMGMAGKFKFSNLREKILTLIKEYWLASRTTQEWRPGIDHRRFIPIMGYILAFVLATTCMVASNHDNFQSSRNGKIIRKRYNLQRRSKGFLASSTRRTCL
jgi:hypothetical protein